MDMLQRIALATALTGLAAGCKQPKPHCNVARGEFAAVYTLQEGSGPCAELHGETLFIDAYPAQRSASDKRPNFDEMTLAIQPAALVGLGDPSAPVKPYSLGAFAGSDPGSDDFCTVPTLTPAQLQLPESPASADMCPPTPAQPAMDVTYTWSNVRAYVTPDALGTTFSADLTYADAIAGCSARYRVWAVYPVVSCNAADYATDIAHADGGAPPLNLDGGLDGGLSTDLDASGLSDGEALPEDDDGGTMDDVDGACPPEEPGEAPAEPMADDTLCTPGTTGINPDYDVRCEPSLMLCVPRKEPPSPR
jgi:hypothetical protein